MANQITTKLAAKPGTGRREPKDWRKYCDLRAVYRIFVKNRDENGRIHFSDLLLAVEVLFHKEKIQQTADFFETFDGCRKGERQDLLQLCLDNLIEAGVIEPCLDEVDRYALARTYTRADA